MVWGMDGILGGINESDDRYRRKRMDNIEQFRAYRDLFPDQDAGGYMKFIEELSDGDRFLRGGLPGQKAVDAMVKKREQDVAYQDQQRQHQGVKMEFETNSLMDQALDKAINQYDDPLEVIDAATNMLPETLRGDARKRWGKGGVSRMIQTRQAEIGLNWATKLNGLGISDVGAARDFLKSQNVPQGVQALAIDVVQRNASNRYSQKRDAFLQTVASDPNIQYGFASGDPALIKQAEEAVANRAAMMGFSDTSQILADTRSWFGATGQLSNAAAIPKATETYIKTVYQDPVARRLAQEGQVEALNQHLLTMLPDNLQNNTADTEQALTRARAALDGAGTAGQFVEHDSKVDAAKAAGGKLFDTQEENRLELIDALAPQLALGIGASADTPYADSLSTAISQVGRETGATHDQIKQALSALGEGRVKTAYEDNMLPETLRLVLTNAGVSSGGTSSRKSAYVADYVQTMTLQPKSANAIVPEAEQYLALPKRITEEVLPREGLTPTGLANSKQAAINQINSRIAQIKQYAQTPDRVFGGQLDQGQAEATIVALRQAIAEIEAIQLPKVEPKTGPAPQSNLDKPLELVKDPNDRFGDGTKYKLGQEQARDIVKYMQKVGETIPDGSKLVKKQVYYQFLKQKFGLKSDREVKKLLSAIREHFPTATNALR